MCIGAQRTPMGPDQVLIVSSMSNEHAIIIASASWLPSSFIRNFDEINSAAEVIYKFGG